MEEKKKNNDNFIGTFVDASIDSAAILAKESWKFTKWCFDGWTGEDFDFFKWLMDGWIDFDKPNFDILFEEIKLYNSKKNKPILKKSNSSEANHVYLFTIPTGLCLKDFHKNIEAIAQFLHTDLQHIKIENINNLACITVCHKDDIIYNYEDYQFQTEAGIKIPIGINLNDYSIVYWQPSEPSETHLLIGGSTGAGKSVALSVILAHIIKFYKNAELYLQDTKSLDLFVFEKAMQVTVFNEGKDYVKETAKRLNEIREEREKEIKKYNCRNIEEMPKKRKPNYIFYVLEELASFNPKQEDAETYKYIADLLSKGRASGIYVILTTQAPYSEILPGMLKNNINTTLGLKTKTIEASKVVCGDYDALVNLRGKGHGKLFNANGVQELKCFNIQKDTIKKIVTDSNK